MEIIVHVFIIILIFFAAYTVLKIGEYHSNFPLVLARVDSETFRLITHEIFLWIVIDNIGLILFL